MTHSFYLTPAELQDITAALQDERPQVRRKANALLLLHQGHSFSEVVAQSGVQTRGAIYKWINRWRKDGIEGLASHRSGRPPVAGTNYRAALESLLSESPLDYGYETEGWIVEDLRTLLHEITGDLMSDTAFRDLLHRMGYSFQIVSKQPPPRPTRMTRQEWAEWRNSFLTDPGKLGQIHTWRKNK